MKSNQKYYFGEYETIGDQGPGQYLDEEMLSHYIDEDGNYSMLPPNQGPTSPMTQTPENQESTEEETAVETRRVKKPTPNAFRGPFDFSDFEED